MARFWAQMEKKSLDRIGGGRRPGRGFKGGDSPECATWSVEIKQHKIQPSWFSILRQADENAIQPGKKHKRMSVGIWSNGKQGSKTQVIMRALDFAVAEILIQVLGDTEVSKIDKAHLAKAPINISISHIDVGLKAIADRGSLVKLLVFKKRLLKAAKEIYTDVFGDKRGS